MNILFLSLSTAISDITRRGIYPDLLRYFASNGHKVFIISPSERRTRMLTNIKIQKNITTLQVRILNITKTSIVEKGISTLTVQYFFNRAIKKYLRDVQFDLILYATPPITFNKLIRKIKLFHKAKTYLLLKDIFPQNAIDLGVLSKINPLYYYFRRQEIDLYRLSDFIGCMSPANQRYLIEKNPSLSSEKIEVCPNSITPINADLVEKKEIVLQRYGIPNDKVLCIYGGNLGKPQGVGFLVNVLLHNKDREDVFFIISGSGTELYRIERLFEKNKISNALLLPQLNREEFDNLVNASDIGLIFLDGRFTIPNYPSRLLNYLEFCKPVLMAIDLSTDIGKIAEENGYGYWVASGDTANFTKKMNSLIENSVLREEMGKNGFRFLLNNYTVEIAYKKIISHFY